MDVGESQLKDRSAESVALDAGRRFKEVHTGDTDGLSVARGGAAGAYHEIQENLQSGGRNSRERKVEHCVSFADFEAEPENAAVPV